MPTMISAPAHTISVLVVDDHAVFAQSLAAALDGSPGIDVIAVANSGSDAVKMTTEFGPDIVLLDLQLPDVSGTELIAEVLAANDATRVVVLTASVDARTARAAVEAGCLGYVTKDQGLDEVLSAVRSVAAGQSVIPSDVLAYVLPLHSRRPTVALTPRELQILELLANGGSNEHIARALGVARNTVRNHVQNLLVKLDAHSRLEAIANARAMKLLADQ